MNYFNCFHAAFKVCVHNSHNGRISGYIACPLLISVCEFTNLGHLLLLLEQTMDAANFPQAFQRSRIFAVHNNPLENRVAHNNHGLTMTEIDLLYGELDTFVICIYSRLKSSWQGELDWLDGQQPIEFSSVLELLKLIDQHFPA